MKYLKMFEDYNNDFLQRVKDCNNYDDFLTLIKSFSDIDKKYLQEYADKINNPTDKGILLYHGTGKYKDILDNGFKITKGERSGFMGGINEVDNQGIFLTDNKTVAHFFGENRAYRNYDVIHVYANLKNCLDFTDLKNIPLDIKKLGLFLINEYEGTNKKTLARRDIWWLLDIKEFVDLLKNKGYDSVRFKEDYKIKIPQESNTYLVFDTNNLTIKKPIIKNLQDFYEYIKNN
jgi:hypothetical protein